MSPWDNEQKLALCLAALLQTKPKIDYHALPPIGDHNANGKSQCLTGMLREERKKYAAGGDTNAVEDKDNEADKAPVTPKQKRQYKPRVKKSDKTPTGGDDQKSIGQVADKDDGTQDFSPSPAMAKTQRTSRAKKDEAKVLKVKGVKLNAEEEVADTQVISAATKGGNGGDQVKGLKPEPDLDGISQGIGMFQKRNAFTLDIDEEAATACAKKLKAGCEDSS